MAEPVDGPGGLGGQADLGVGDDSRAGQPGDPIVNQREAGLIDLVGAEAGHAARPALGHAVEQDGAGRVVRRDHAGIERC